MDQASGTNLLMLKIEKGDIKEVLQCIQKYPKYINMKNKSGNSALTTAIRLNDLSTLKLLLDNKADVNIQTKSNQTPVYLATFNNQIDIVVLLLQYNANVKIADQRGWNPLMVAANKGFIEIVQILLSSQRCDLFHRNQRGETVFELAKNREILNCIVDNCGYEVSEIEGNLGNSIMCGIRAKLNCQNASLFQVQNAQFDAGNFYQKEVKRVQNTFKSICEKNHDQLNKLKSGLANLQNGIIKKELNKINPQLLSENKAILNQQSKSSSSKQGINSTTSHKMSQQQSDKKIPEISSFNYEIQNIPKQLQNNRMIDTPSSVQYESNVTPSKYNSQKINSNQNSQIQKNSSGGGSSTQMMSGYSQNKNIPSAQLMQNNFLSNYASNISNVNSSQKKSNKKVSSFIVTEELPESSSISSNFNSRVNSKNKSTHSIELAQPYDDSNVLESARLKELEEDFLKKSNSELILQYKSQLMSQIKSLIPNISDIIFNQYEKSINYFIEQLIYNPNLTIVEKTLVLMQFQSQILIDIMQQQQSQQSNLSSQLNQKLNHSQSSQLPQTMNTSQSDGLKHSFSYSEQSQESLKNQHQKNEQLNNQQQNIKQPQPSNSKQQKQQNQLELINQDNSKSEEIKYHENPENLTQSSIKEKYYQSAKNKHFQMDGIVEQPTLEMIETPSQSQSQNKKVVFPTIDNQEKQNVSNSFQNNNIRQNQETAIENNEINDDNAPLIMTFSSSKHNSEDEEMFSTFKESLNASQLNLNQKDSQQQLASNREQNSFRQLNSARKQSPSNKQSSLKEQQINKDQGLEDHKYAYLNFNENTINLDELIHHAEYNTIESSQNYTNLFTSDKKKLTKCFNEDEIKYDFAAEQGDNNQDDGLLFIDDYQYEENGQGENQEQILSSDRNKHIFQQVHVFNGNKCQAIMSSAQTSKAQSEIDYEISLTNSGKRNQGMQQYLEDINSSPSFNGSSSIKLNFSPQFSQHPAYPESQNTSQQASLNSCILLV